MLRELLLVATTPTVYGIETLLRPLVQKIVAPLAVATTPTVYGIETTSSMSENKRTYSLLGCNSTYRLRY